jgi:two-component system response regulator RpfG
MHELDEREREILHRLAKATAFHDGGSVASFERLGRYAGLIAEALGLGEDEVGMIELAAPLRDIGKLAISNAILRKPAALDEAEMAEVRKHPELGQELLSGSSSRFVQIGATIALGHQERWDGSGYPSGLAGEDIPLPARIVAVADVLDAMTSSRTWRPAHAFADAMAHIKEGSGTWFDPAVVSAALARREQLEEVFRMVAPGTPRP